MKAFITGVTGQDGSYLAEFLLEKGYDVHALNRRTATDNTDNIKNIKNYIKFYHGDLTESSALFDIIRTIKPDEIYNLGAQSDVGISFKLPVYTAQVNAIAVLNMLESIRVLNLKTKFYQASTSEMYGYAQEHPQTELTPFYPRSPYGISKLFAYWTVKNYREAYGIQASNGILFNHESPRRGNNFVTQKIVKQLRKILDGKQNILELGNLSAQRDWGYAPDYVEGMWLMLQQVHGDDYILATGEMHSVRDFVDEVMKCEGAPKITWVEEGEEEKGYIEGLDYPLVRVNPEFYRPTEVNLLCGDATKAKYHLGWAPTVSFKKLVKIMVNNQ